MTTIVGVEVILHLHVEVAERDRAAFLDFCREAFPVYTMKPRNLRAPRRFMSEDTWSGAQFIWSYER